LKNSISGFNSEFTPQDYERAIEIAPTEFAIDIVESIESNFAANAMTPGVAGEFVQVAMQQRNAVFQQLTELNNSLKYFKFEFEAPQDGTTEVGFQIPRELFENDYEEFLSELDDIKKVIRFFSEVATGEHQKVYLGSLSTTDPLVFIYMSVQLGKLFGGTVVWRLVYGCWWNRFER
jgi:hypothetical protein